MAKLLRADGTVATVTPAPGRRAFTLTEMQDFVGGYIEMVPAREPGIVLVVNEEGLLHNLRRNARASAALREDVVGGIVVGDALLCTRVEAGFNEEVTCD